MEWITHLKDFEMITSETPYKLSEIIRDTWPNLYRPINLKKENDKTVHTNVRSTLR
jgi:hypothetical protein